MRKKKEMIQSNRRILDACETSNDLRIQNRWDRAIRGRWADKKRDNAHDIRNDSNSCCFSVST